jgi:hypothetical protein
MDVVTVAGAPESEVLSVDEEIREIIQQAGDILKPLGDKRAEKFVEELLRVKKSGVAGLSVEQLKQLRDLVLWARQVLVFRNEKATRFTDEALDTVKAAIKRIEMQETLSLNFARMQEALSLEFAKRGWLPPDPSEVEFALGCVENGETSGRVIGAYVQARTWCANRTDVSIIAANGSPIEGTGIVLHDFLRMMFDVCKNKGLPASDQLTKTCILLMQLAVPGVADVEQLQLQMALNAQAAAVQLAATAAVQLASAKVLAQLPARSGVPLTHIPAAALAPGASAAMRHAVAAELASRVQTAAARVREAELKDSRAHPWQLAYWRPESIAAREQAATTALETAAALAALAPGVAQIERLWAVLQANPTPMPEKTQNDMAVHMAQALRAAEEVETAQTVAVENLWSVLQALDFNLIPPVQLEQAHATKAAKVLGESVRLRYALNGVVAAQRQAAVDTAQEQLEEILMAALAQAHPWQKYWSPQILIAKADMLSDAVAKSAAAKAALRAAELKIAKSETAYELEESAADLQSAATQLGETETAKAFALQSELVGGRWRTKANVIAAIAKVEAAARERAELVVATELAERSKGDTAQARVDALRIEKKSDVELILADALETAAALEALVESKADALAKKSDVLSDALQAAKALAEKQAKGQVEKF